MRFLIVDDVRWNNEVPIIDILEISRRIIKQHIKLFTAFLSFIYLCLGMLKYTCRIVCLHIMHIIFFFQPYVEKEVERHLILFFTVKYNQRITYILYINLRSW